MQMKANKSCIGSEIPTVLLKSCSDIFCEIFYKFFNLMLCFNLIPQKLKELIVLPIYKKGKPINSFDSYRPITIEKNILKLFCKLIFNNISSFVNKTNVIPHNQYGFRPNLSVYNQLIDILYFITNSFNDKNVLCVDIIFLDMSNAFDRLSFKSILEACHEIGIRNDCLKILENYLIGRKQKILYNNNYSEYKEINSGIPQGGVGSPELFNLTVRDFPNVTRFSKLFQFADDSCFLKVIYDIKDVQDFQADLNHIQDYCNLKNFKLNTEKSVHLRVKFKNIDLIGYQMNGQSIETKTSHKHLGFILDNKLSNNENVEHIYNNSLKKWHFLRKLFPYARYDILLKLFKTYILPIIESNNNSLILNITQNNKIEKIQRKITKQICNSMSENNLEYKARLKLLELDSLESRRKFSIIKLLYKSVNNHPGIPDHWKTKYDIKDNNRNGLLLYKPFARNCFSDKNMFNYSIDLFNSLPKILRNQIMSKTFLTNCKSFFNDN